MNQLEYLKQIVQRATLTKVVQWLQHSSRYDQLFALEEFSLDLHYDISETEQSDLEKFDPRSCTL